jgi:hypothetical protein
MSTTIPYRSYRSFFKISLYVGVSHHQIRDYRNCDTLMFLFTSEREPILDPVAEHTSVDIVPTGTQFSDAI